MTRGPGQQLHSQFSSEERNSKLSQNGTLGHTCVKMMKSRLYDSRVRDHVYGAFRFKCNQSHP